MPRTNEGIKTEDAQSRPRRSRPEPYQLEALKKLLHRTSTPSIEQRNALALEVGMYVNFIPSCHILYSPPHQGPRQSHKLVPQHSPNGP
jgi:hypothetical protein